MSEPANLVTVTQTRNQCCHVHANGRQCGSPALRKEIFCYFHHTTRRPKRPAGKLRFLDAEEPFELPLVEDLPSALSVAAQLLCRIASNDLDTQRAGKLLYNLQIITSIIDKATRAAKTGAPSVPVSLGRAGSAQLVEELVHDETHGPIAPVREYTEPAPTPSVPASSGRAESDTTPPPPPRDFTPEEHEYFKHTVFARGYEPSSKYPRPSTITDEDIQASAHANRRVYGLPALEARKDANGRLISYHEKGARHTIPPIEPPQPLDQPQPATNKPQPAPIPSIHAVATPCRRPPHQTPSSRSLAPQNKTAPFRGWLARRTELFIR